VRSVPLVRARRAMSSSKQAAPDAPSPGPQPPRPVRRALALSPELARVPPSTTTDVLHLAHMGQLGVLHLTLLLAWLDGDVLMLDFVESSSMSVEAMRVFAMAVGTLAAFTDSGIMAAMEQRAANDEWPGATRSASRCAHGEQSCHGACDPGAAGGGPGALHGVQDANVADVILEIKK